ncbi:hypothetical protein JZ751_011509 [Albula glossodonta]|uniref:Uncharacterized protein n=1 Tax=Albula glossodonta TaxID=121402 RepID=A0A8T2MTG2_9TELE|nr:hypothetical protein JZ751_011509 [Albula glossodonta]
MILMCLTNRDGIMKLLKVGIILTFLLCPSSLRQTVRDAQSAAKPPESSAVFCGVGQWYRLT